MKKLSNELYKVLTLLFICFFILFFLPVNLVENYLEKNSREEIRIVETFLHEEFLEPEHQDLDYFLEEILHESPKKSNFYIQVEYHGKTYADGDKPDLRGVVFSDKIQFFKDRYLYVLNTKVETLDHGAISLLIANNQHDEKLFINKLFYYTLLTALAFAVLSLYILSLIKKGLTPQLKKLESIENMTDLENFTLKLNKDDFYQEFSDFLSSYENILKTLQQNHEFQNDFINNASHELKTPLFVIQGYVNLLKKQGVRNPELFREAVSTIHDEVKSMNSLIEKLLFLSKGKKFPVKIEKIDLTELVQEVISEMEIIYPQQKFILHPKKFFLNSDWALLKQVIRNIVDNGVKYGNDNPVHIYLLKRGDYLCINVIDSGYGISKKDLKNLFSKFYRVDKSRSREIHGHGLGLSIVKNILEILKGSIELSSEPGKGTEVLIKVPLDYNRS